MLVVRVGRGDGEDGVGVDVDVSCFVMWTSMQLGQRDVTFFHFGGQVASRIERVRGNDYDVVYLYKSLLRR
jgi:stress response protein SCP2